MVSNSEFVWIKSQLLVCTPAQVKELRAVLSMLDKNKPKVADVYGERVDEVWFGILKDVRQYRTRIRIPFGVRDLHKHDGHAASKMYAVSVYLETALCRFFPSCKSKIGKQALRRFIASVAFSKCVDDERPLTFGYALDVLMPLEDLLDAQFPGYRASGVLESVIMQRLNVRES